MHNTYEKEKFFTGFKGGDSYAFKIFFDALYPRLYKVCFKITGDHFQSEDIAVSALSVVLMKHETYSSYPELEGTVMVIARNKSVDYVRRMIREEAVMIDYCQLSKIHAGTSQEDRQLNMESFAVLSEKQRRVIDLKYYQGYTYKDIGRILRITPKCAEKLVSRALKRMRASLFQKIK